MPLEKSIKTETQCTLNFRISFRGTKKDLFEILEGNAYNELKNYEHTAFFSEDFNNPKDK